MGRSFYKDEEEKYSVPGLPTVEQVKTEEKPDATTIAAAPETEVRINKYGNLITTAPALQKLVSQIRESTEESYARFIEKYEYITGTGKAHLAMAGHRIAEFKGEDETLLPNICGVLTATLAGSIIARSHSFPIRFLFPVLFGSVALKYSLPQTYNNIATEVKEIGLNVEEKYFPEFKQTRTGAAAKKEEFFHSVDQLKEDSWNGLVSSVSSSRRFICETFKKD